VYIYKYNLFLNLYLCMYTPFFLSHSDTFFPHSLSLLPVYIYMYIYIHIHQIHTKTCMKNCIFVTFTYICIHIYIYINILPFFLSQSDPFFPHFESLLAAAFATAASFLASIILYKHSYKIHKYIYMYIYIYIYIYTSTYMYI
jgi:hypothetical protein